MAYEERFCPQCRKSYLIVIRGTQLVGVTRMEGRHRATLKEALGALDGLTSAEVDRLVAMTVDSDGRQP